MIWSPQRHETVSSTPWNGNRARAVVQSITHETLAAFDETRLWCLNPEDRYPGVDLEPMVGLYLGAAGTVIGLASLSRFVNGLDVRDIAMHVFRRAREIERKEPVGAGYLIGIAGPALAAAVYSADEEAFEILHRLADESIGGR